MPTIPTTTLLRAVPFFSGLSDEDLAILARTTHQRSYRRNEVIFHRDDPGSTLYLIQDGQVKISLPNIDGDEVTLAILRVGEMFGELSLLDELPRSATATALTPTIVLIVTRKEFLNAISRDPEVAAQVMTVIGKRLRRTNDTVEDIITRDVAARVARKLIDLATTHGSPTDDGIAVQLRLTQQDLASMIGATRESTNKVLRAYILKGWVGIDGHTIIVRKPAELSKRIY